jgi:hypothetical protein
VNASHLVCARVRPRFWGDIRPSAPEIWGDIRPSAPEIWGDMRLLLIESLD